MTRIGLGIALALVVAASACAPMGDRHGTRGMPQRASTVTVAGQGTVTAAPDMAEITIGVVTQAPTAAQALAANSQAMERLLQGRTTLIIAHRLSSLRNADRILVIIDGRIAEQGTHDGLMASKGAYASLYDAQFVI